MLGRRLLLAFAHPSATAGVARQPPMGWRSWYFNIFDMGESVWNATVDALVDTSRLVCVALPTRAAVEAKKGLLQ